MEGGGGIAAGAGGAGGALGALGVLKKHNLIPSFLALWPWLRVLTHISS